MRLAPNRKGRGLPVPRQARAGTTMYAPTIAERQLPYRWFFRR
jgi:hypothetical protein